jgi:ribosomal protein S27E
VSYASREKKRKHKRIEKKARRSRSAETARRWFLIVAKKPGRCSICRTGFGRGAQVVYRHEGREVRCERCAALLEDSKGYRASLRWEKQRRPR